MKTVSSLFCNLLFVALLSQTACKKDSGNPNDDLPPLTMEGKNVIACLVNGRVVKNKNNGGLTPTENCFYQKAYPTDNGYYFHLSSSDKSVANERRNIHINVDSMTVREGLVIPLGKAGKGAAYGEYHEWRSTTITEFKTSEILKGELVIRKFDEQKSIAAGTFWFNAISSNGDTVRVTDGRFDMQFTQ